MLDSGGEFSWLDSSGEASRGDAGRTSDQGRTGEEHRPNDEECRASQEGRRASQKDRRTSDAEQWTSDEGRCTDDDRRVERYRDSTTAVTCTNVLLTRTMPLLSHTDYCHLATSALSPALLVIHAPLLFLLRLLLANRNDNVLLQLKYDILGSKSKKYLHRMSLCLTVKGKIAPISS